jgi:hypothetical protein
LTRISSGVYHGGNTVYPMSKSYFPSERAGQITWHNNFAAEFPKVGESLGFSAPEVTSAVNDSKYAAYILGALGPEIDADPAHAAHAVLDGQSQAAYVDLPTTSGAPPAVRPGIDTRRQARVERIKAHAKFSEAITKQLKIESAKVDPKSYKAELGRARLTGNYVTIPFRKAGGNVSGINLYRQCKGQSEPKQVGFFWRTPAIDTTPISGRAEDCSYTARAVLDGKEVGQPSDAVMVVAG